MDLKVKYTRVFGQAAESSQFLKVQCSGFGVLVKSSFGLTVLEGAGGAILIPLGLQVLPDISGSFF